MPRNRQFDESEVLEKAMMLFWRNGYHHTSIDDLVKVLGINRGSLYGTFGGKGKLFERAFELYRREYRKRMVTLLNTQTDIRNGLSLLFEKVIDADCSDPDCRGCFVVNTTTELLPGDERIEEVLKLHKQQIEAQLFEFLKKGVDQGQISGDKDLPMLATLLYTFMTGLRVNGKIKPSKEESMSSVRAVLRLLD